MAGWIRKSPVDFEGEENGFALHVYFDTGPVVFGPPFWSWSAMRFMHPGNEMDDREVHIVGTAPSCAAAKRAATRAASNYRPPDDGARRERS